MDRGYLLPEDGNYSQSKITENEFGDGAYLRMR